MIIIISTGLWWLGLIRLMVFFTWSNDGRLAGLNAQQRSISCNRTIMESAKIKPACTISRRHVTSNEQRNFLGLGQWDKLIDVNNTIVVFIKHPITTNSYMYIMCVYMYNYFQFPLQMKTTKMLTMLWMLSKHSTGCWSKQMAYSGSKTFVYFLSCVTTGIL